MRRIVIVGAGPAGLTAGRELRRLGFDGELTVIGAEPHAPYRRPPLSKEFLRADVDLGLRGGEELAADWRLGQAATGLDLAGRQVLCGPGEPVAFDGLVIATGLRARTLPGASRRPGVIALRGVDDALALRAALSSRPRVVVAGGGFLGVELALTLRSMDLPVTLVASDRVPLRAPLGDHAGGIIAGLLRESGVALRLGRRVAAAQGDDRLEHVRLDDGAVLPAGLLVTAIGVESASDWLRDSGLRLDEGVVVDRAGLAAPGVAAAGDVARRPHPLWEGRLLRVEHHGDAVEQGAGAARALLGRPLPAPPIPAFWSDLGRHRLQGVGFTGARYEARLVRHEADHRFLIEYRSAGRLVGAAAAGFTGALLRYRTRITEEMT